MCVVALPERAFAAVKTTLKSPVCPDVGVQVNVPDVFDAFAVNVAPEGSDAAVSEVMVCASLAVTVNVSIEPAVTVSVAGAVTIGASSEPDAFTVIWKFAVADSPFAVAVTLPLNVPTSLAVGFRVIVVETS